MLEGSKPIPLQGTCIELGNNVQRCVLDYSLCTCALEQCGHSSTGILESSTLCASGFARVGILPSLSASFFLHESNLQFCMMAEALDIVEKGLEELEEITCPICQGHFREPKILPCLHYCKECVQQLALRAGAVPKYFSKL